MFSQINCFDLTDIRCTKSNRLHIMAIMLGERGEEIPAGTFIMTGGITAAVAVNKGDNITVRYQDLGSVSAKFV